MDIYKVLRTVPGKSCVFVKQKKVCQTLLRFVVIILNQSMQQALSTLKLHECVGGNRTKRIQVTHQDSY